MDDSTLSYYTQAPIEVEIKIKGRNNKESFLKFHCVKTKAYRPLQYDKWCATKVDNRGRIYPISLKLFRTILQGKLRDGVSAVKAADTRKIPSCLQT